MKKVGVISLGCPKNLVDTEIFLGAFKKEGHEIVTDPNNADIILINTCAFILPSIKESISNIIEMIQYNKKIIVCGCLAERFKDNLLKEIPEINKLIPFSSYNNLPTLLKDYGKNFNFDEFNRVLSTSRGIAYLRIAEGCNNFCSFCAIPYIRGRYKSRTIKDLVKESKLLVKQGVKIIEIIAQDTISYGKDLKEKVTIIDLLKELEKIKELKYIRLLYLYPNKLIKPLVNYIKNSKKVLPYFDLPIQHVSDKLLKSMNRHFNKDDTINCLNYIRKQIPNSIIRTSIIVGYPGETKKDFDELINFVKDFKFDHLGVFAYSREEGTKAYNLANQVSEKLKENRREKLSKIQLKISYDLNQSHISEIIDGLCTNVDTKTNTYYFVTKFNANGDIDGSVIYKGNKQLIIGNIYKLKIIDSFVYDLLVDVLNK